MLHKTSSDLLCVICSKPADTSINDCPLCTDCASKKDVQEYLDKLLNFG